jgi:hypothetical protein
LLVLKEAVHERGVVARAVADDGVFGKLATEIRDNLLEV